MEKNGSRWSKLFCFENSCLTFLRWKAWKVGPNKQQAASPAEQTLFHMHESIPELSTQMKGARRTCYLLTEGRVQKCHTNLQSSLRIKVKCHGQTRCWKWALFHCQPLFHTRRALCAPHWSKLSKSHMMSRAQNTGTDVRGPFLWHWLFVLFFQIFSLFRDKYPACDFPKRFDLATVLYYLPSDNLNSGLIIWPWALTFIYWCENAPKL